MTSVAHVRTASRRLDEVEQRAASHGGETWAVAGKPFLTITTEPDTVQLRLPADDARAVLDDIPGSTLVCRGSSVLGVEIRLDLMNGMQANAVIGRAWAHRAPARLARSVDPAAQSDLPPAIGRPATRALHAAKVTTLADLARHTRAEIAALHGVGPRALGLLDAALADRSLPWALG